MAEMCENLYIVCWNLKKNDFPKLETSQVYQFWHVLTMVYYCPGERWAPAKDGVTIAEPVDSFGQAARHGRVTLSDFIDTEF